VCILCVCHQLVWVDGVEVCSIARAGGGQGQRIVVVTAGAVERPPV
jgi:hypothetical protein